MCDEKTTRAVFMGTPAFGVPALEALVEAGYQVVGVFTQPDRPSGRGRKSSPAEIKRSAVNLGLKVLQPKSLKEPWVIEELKYLRPDVILIAAYGLIVPKEVLDIPPLGTLNIHPSLLPKYRGASPVAGAIIAGEDVTGVTIMVTTMKVDAGPTLSAAEVKILPQDTSRSLSIKLSSLAADLLIETLPRWAKGEIKPQVQDESKATYSKKISKEDGEIDWELSAVEIWRQVRAFDPWPGSYTRWNRKLLKLLQTEPMEECNLAEPGRVIRLNEPDRKPRIGVETGSGILIIEKIQLEGRNVAEMDSFILGHGDFTGAKLPS